MQNITKEIDLQLYDVYLQGVLPQAKATSKSYPSENGFSGLGIKSWDMLTSEMFVSIDSV